ncbi:hypothetical protein [Bacillus sp. FJAT-50079]|uniref:hypothetical protein n=1 Tax=Bacillus sp. FJAT-50079 TaxID=2833577 RepID=UPI001BCA2106|nr:hypothetical protein [Bacillus sp. FJAT-50079]MBS4207377.1 hypothetical protein [Bacillus sp. FJAT-50079]
MSVQMRAKDAEKDQAKNTFRHGQMPPRNPNKRPTIINMSRSIGRMKANDRDAIMRAR